MHMYVTASRANRSLSFSLSTLLNYSRKKNSLNVFARLSPLHAGHVSSVLDEFVVNVNRTIYQANFLVGTEPEADC
jgi:hypothetical protein